MIPSLLQAVTADLFTGDDATQALLGLLSVGRSFEAFLQRAAPPIEKSAEAPRQASPPDAPLALALGILAFHGHLTASLKDMLREDRARKAASQPSQPVRPVSSLPPRGLLR